MPGRGTLSAKPLRDSASSRLPLEPQHDTRESAADAEPGDPVAGLQVPAEDRHLLPAALDKIGYRYWDESDNPAYKLFLG